MFISKGEAGVYAAAGAEPFSQTGCEGPQSVAVLGQLHFDDLQSVDHVVHRHDRPFIAPRLGGIEVVNVQLD